MKRRLALLALALLPSLSFAETENPPNVRLKTSMGDIVIELNAEKAPITVANFLNYVENKHYDGTVFHRVISSFMVQGGGFAKDGGQLIEKPTGPGIKNESNNGLSNIRGTVAMARKRDPNSATAQFFINVVDNSKLDYPNYGGYTVFGEVVEGMDVVDRIRSVRTGTREITAHDSQNNEQIIMPSRDVPIDDIVIQSATIEVPAPPPAPEPIVEPVEVVTATPSGKPTIVSIDHTKRFFNPLWLCPLIAFLMGSIPFGFLFGKAKGIDIREHGSGNIGATNVWRILGTKFGLPCLLLDALKGLIPTILAITWIRFEGQSETMAITPLLSQAYIFPVDKQFTAQLLVVLSGLLAILGHNYSPWVAFKGGKGIATSAGVIIALMPAAIVILLIIWLLLYTTTRYVSVASIGVAALLPVITLAGSWFHGRVQDGTWNQPLFIFSLTIGILAIWKHRSNIERLLNGTEHRFTRKKANRS